LFFLDLDGINLPRGSSRYFPFFSSEVKKMNFYEFAKRGRVYKEKKRIQSAKSDPREMPGGKMANLPGPVER